MPTNDERIKVAARLRKLDASKWSGYSDEYNDIRRACLIDGDEYYDVELHERLADLIEPEERTCRMTKKGNEFVLAGWWECSECGHVYPPCNDEIAVWALQKCPRCVAKVVE